MAQTAASDARQGRYVKANGLDVYYEEQGSGPPLVLVGWGVALWAAYISTLAQHFRVLVADSRGLGKTNNPGKELSYRLLADDLAAFIECLGLHKPLVCGYSDGGQIALELGMRYPDVARALVVGAACWRFSEASVECCRHIGMEAPGVVDFERFAKEAAYFVSTFMSSATPDHWKTVAKQLSVMYLTPLGYTREHLEHITAPTLVLVGDRDECVPVEEAVELYRLIPNAELVVAPGSSHGGLLFQNRVLFDTLVLDFSLRHSAQATQ